MPATKVTSYETTDWTDLSTAPNTVTANGNRSYSLVFNSTDYTGLIQPGTRIRTTRTVAAPTQCTSLNGTNQYYSRASANVAGMTFTNNFVVSAWVKLNSYTTQSEIMSRFNGTSGWSLYIATNGQVNLAGWNAGGANYAVVYSSQSVPLNKWVHIAAQLDMTVTTISPTTNYVMFDGVDVPANFARGGTNPTALVQAGNLEVGSRNGGSNFFNGKLAQVAVYSAKVTQATILASINQGLVGTETSLISAYSFNNSINDLNTTNANNLTAQNSAVATNADSPFGGNSFGTISSTLDYGIVHSSVFSTNTTLVVQVPEGCTIPTTGGVTTVSYSGLKAPYGMPASKIKWLVKTLVKAQGSQTSATLGTWYNVSGVKLTIPVGDWIVNYQVKIYTSTGTGASDAMSTLSTANNTSSDTEWEARIDQGSGALVGVPNTPIFRQKDIGLSTQTAYYLNVKYGAGSGTTTIYNLADQTNCSITAENAYL